MGMSKITLRRNRTALSSRPVLVEAMEGRVLMSSTQFVSGIAVDPIDPSLPEAPVVVAKVTTSDISIVKSVDKASPKLFL
jgi:hypothetical protein